jgi:cysteine desulfurase
MDHNASTALSEAAAARMLEVATRHYGNPSSLHWAGVGAHEAMEAARAQVASLVGGRPSELIFTGGGTEADVLALASMVARGRAQGRPARIALWCGEHPALREALKARELSGEARAIELGATPEGGVALDELRAALDEGLDGLCVMAAHNETGALPDLEAIARALAGYEVWWHCDAVQAAGKLPLDVAQGLGARVTSAALAAHKLGGPKGVGALWVRSGATVEPLWTGGGQERGRRGGTPNAPGIAAFGVAAQEARARLEGGSFVRDQERLRAALEAGLRARSAQLVVFAHEGPRLPNTTFLAARGERGWADGGRLVLALSRAGVAASTGSACHAGQRGRNRILAAMGVPPQVAHASVRLSLGVGSTDEDVEALLALWPSCLAEACEELDPASGGAGWG